MQFKLLLKPYVIKQKKEKYRVKVSNRLIMAIQKIIQLCTQVDNKLIEYEDHKT